MYQEDPKVVAHRKARLDALVKIPVRVDTGEVVEVAVCWDRAKVSAYLAGWPDGIADLKQIESPGYSKTGTTQEIAWLAHQARALAGRTRSIFRGALARMRAAHLENAKHHAPEPAGRLVPVHKVRSQRT